MKFSFGIILLVITLATHGKAQQDAASKLVTEIIASSSTQTVKGAPFSAEAITESVQTLADGNRLTRKSTTRMYRDGEGRFRRDEISAPGGSLGSFLSVQQTNFIFDPVAGVRFLLDPTFKTVRRINLGSRTADEASKAAAAQLELKKRLESAVARPNAVTEPNRALPGAAKTESLGSKIIEGVEAEGTRTTYTIPPGAVGNERAIDIVYERWYSKDLQLIVLSKHSDPRFGEQTYRLTNINRKEPERSLFSPPADYKLIAEPSLSPPGKP